MNLLPTHQYRVHPSLEIQGYYCRIEALNVTVLVAHLNRSVCLWSFGGKPGDLAKNSMSEENPMSNILSASSRTKNFMFWRLIVPSVTNCFSLPGVPAMKEISI